MNLPLIVISNKYARYKTVSGVFCFPSIEERAKLCNELDNAKISYKLITCDRGAAYIVSVK